MNYLLGVDAGTTSMKAVLIDENGRRICHANENYHLATQTAYEAEIDAGCYWNAFRKVVKSIIDISGISAGKITALSVDSQGETLICVDNDGNPLRKAIVWLDNRSTLEAEEIKRDFGIEKVFNVTGQPEVAATWPATKILWLGKNEKHIFEKTAKFLMVSDYINYRLSGRYVTDRTVVSSSLYYDIRKNNWWGEMLDYTGITENRLPYVESPGVRIGNVTGQASKETGLSQKTIIVTGALDQMAGAIGAGNISPKVVSESTGTCLAMCVSVKNPIPYRENLKIPCHCSALPGGYSLLFWSQTAGAILEWYKDNFFMINCDGTLSSTYYQSNKSPYERIDSEAANAAPGSDGLIVLPHFSGSAVPHFTPNAKGVFFGVTLNHTRAHFSRAIMEASAYMLREHIEMAESLGIDIREIRSFGGGARSGLWNQIKADVTGKEVVTLENPETTSLGAAMLAGIGAGVFEDFTEACSKCVKEKERYYPDMSNFQTYEVSFEKYKKLYDSTSRLSNAPETPAS